MHKMKLMALGAAFAALAMPLVALAQPPLPSSFYGTVKLDGANVPEGVSVVAYVGGSPIATATTQTFQGNTVYAINVAGDDPTTTAVEGGTAGAQVFFAIGNTYVATEVGTWATGTNVSLNLTASSAPAATPTPEPTAVPPTATAAPQPTATSAPAPVATATPRPAATATPAAAALPKVGDSAPPGAWMALVVAGIAALGAGAWSLRRVRG